MITRDTTSSLSAATDRKLTTPICQDQSCPWEPNDSSLALGKLFLGAVVEGQPEYQEFGPQSGDLKWAAALRDTWTEIQEHYADVAFTDARIAEWEDFMMAYPWGGIKDLPPSVIPPYRDVVFTAIPPGQSDIPAEMAVMLNSIGQDGSGRPRLFYSMEGKDLLSYPRVLSRVTYGNVYLDGTAHRPKKRKRKGASH